MINSIKHTIKDLHEGALRWQLWTYLARDDLFNIHKNTLFGFLWEPLSFIILVAALGPLYAELMGVPLLDYIVYFSAGWLTWRMISVLVASSTITYISSVKIITQVKLPYSFYSYKQVCNSFYIFLLNLLVFIIIVFFAGVINKVVITGMFLALLIYMVTGFFLSIVIGYFSLLFRDLSAIIDNIMRISFFITPVIWGYNHHAQDTGLLKWSAKAVYIEYNPFYHYLVLLREPMLGNPVPELSYLFTLIMMGLLVLFGFYILLAKRRQFAYLV